MNNKTIQGLEHDVIDRVSAAILMCEASRYDDMRKVLMEAIGIVVEMRILHDRIIADYESTEHPKPRDELTGYDS